MPRKKPEQLKSAGGVSEKKVAPAATTAPAQAATAPVIPVSAPLPAPTATMYHPADTNGDGTVSKEEHEMYMEFKRKELEDADAMRDAQRTMTWFALAGLLLYPFAVVLAVLAGLDSASKILGDMAATYFVAVAGIVAAFFGSQAYSKKK